MHAWVENPEFEELEVGKRLFEIDRSKLPNLPGMMFRTVEALRELGGSGTIKEIDEAVGELEDITDAELTYTMKDGRRLRFNYYMAWARTYLKRGSIVINSSHGVWSLTPNEKQFRKIEDAKKIHESVTLEERERSRLKRLQEKQDQDDDATFSSEMAVDSPDLETKWRQQLLEIISEMSPAGFERLSQRLMREAGFIKVEVRGRTGDGGIDGVGLLRMNLVTFQVYFQSKKWKGSVGAKEIRDFRGALQGRADKGLFISTGSFTASATEEATRDGALAIDLIDGERLCDLLRSYSLGLTIRKIERIDIDQDWYRNL